MGKNSTHKIWSFSFYFLFFAGGAALFNFLALYFESQGLPGGQIGILMGASALVGLFAGPAATALADATQRHRLILFIAIVGNVACYVVFPFFHTFGWYLLLIVLGSIFGGPILSLTDNATMSMLAEEKQLFGRVRLGGTIGWGLMAPLAAAIVAGYGLAWIFWIYGGMLLVALVAVRRMRFAAVRSETAFLHGVRRLLTDPKWILFLGIMLVAGSGNAAISNYFLVYLDRIGSSKVEMGLAITIATLAELPAMLFADRLLGRIKSRGVLTLGLVATAVRCMLYGLVGVPWIALIVQLMQMVTYPLLLVAGVSYAHENSPAGMSATGQGIFNSAFWGIGSVAGGFFGGLLLQYLGVQQMFFVFGATILAAALLFGLLQRAQPAPAQDALPT
jgi:PPP family 3-phenylpropionic acid transporter